ncbi:MAG: response regulator [Alphaproteobacteria bacterium]|nr:response regulator [Alphaproteobacteria bacterium]
MATEHRVLLIEDNDVDAAVFSRSVEAMEGWTVLRVGSLEEAEEAVDQHGAHAFSLVAVDLTLPDAFDLEAIHFARTYVPLAACVAVTSRNPDEVDERALRAGAADLLVKGQMNARGVQRAVSHAVDRNELIRRQLESERNLRSVLAAWSDALLVVDARHHLLFRNDAAAALADGLFETTAEGERLALDIQPGDVLRREVPRRGGDPVPVELRSWRITWADQPAQVVVLQDRRAERAAQRTAAMAEAGRGALQGVHDIGNRVTAMMGALADARAVLDAHDHPEALHDLLDRLEASCEHIADVVRSARQGATKVRHRRIPVDVSTLVSTATHNHRRDLEAAAALRLQLEPVTEVFGDPAELTRIVDNLLRNAIEAIGPGQPDRHEIRVSVRQEDDRVLVEIEDTGPGIPPETLERIFEEGFTGKAEGTGLGLASARAIALDHKGTLSVTSTIGQGACFRLELPASRARSTGVRVLLIEDHAEVARANRRLLGDRYAIEVANDGREALDRIATDAAWSVILCDLDMPGMDGVAFFEAIRSDHEPLAERVIFCTGGATTPDVEHFLTASGRPVLAKPLDQFEAIRTIDAVAQTG